MTTSQVSSKIRTEPAAATRLRSAGVLLVAAFVVFVAGVAMMIVFSSDYDRALTAAAQERGVGVNDLPAAVIGPIHRENDVLWQTLLIFGPVIGSLALFTAAVHIGTRAAGGDRRLAAAAVVAGGLTPLTWVGLLALERGVASAAPNTWNDLYDTANAPLMALSTIAGSLAVILLTVLLRRVGVARRTGLVVIPLGVLFIAVAPALGAPPILPLLLGLFVGIVMIRTVRPARNA